MCGEINTKQALRLLAEEENQQSNMGIYKMISSLFENEYMKIYKARYIQFSEAIGRKDFTKKKRWNI